MISPFRKEVSFCSFDDRKKIDIMRKLLYRIGFSKVASEFYPPLEMHIEEYRRGEDKIELRIEGMDKASILARSKIHEEIAREKESQ